MRFKRGPGPGGTQLKLVIGQNLVFPTPPLSLANPASPFNLYISSCKPPNSLNSFILLVLKVFGSASEGTKALPFSSKKD